MELSVWVCHTLCDRLLILFIHLHANLGRSNFYFFGPESDKFCLIWDSVQVVTFYAWCIIQYTLSSRRRILVRNEKPISNFLIILF